ncbi:MULTISPECIES: winged helix-turn-helix transcriptional regulator [Planococcus]|uniref:Transcriptional regulator n=1 Tax=Planococcus faecalis TaxID=1598147 RepID=A0ABM6ISE8_9BACL|nr:MULTISPECIES: winged helix-turn-helix transcriptional regulator [Planococcus]AQU79496.1 transcriptional regulator [Planococcus faecalis]MDJ0332919.1 winged helix-turn-helix transcriptional regulator [Planococcus sp. S3-L1]OHX51195.1 transcriptional regulator [Planococcus faecalis]
MEIHYKEKTYFSGKDLALSAIGGRWKIAVIWCLLHDSPLRLSEIQKKLPQANQRMLIRQLRELEEDQIITRFVYPVVPPRVEYQLSDIGLRLEPVVTSICNWGDEFSDFVRKEATKIPVE